MTKELAITVWQSPRGDYKAWSEGSWMYTWGPTADEAVDKLRRRLAARAPGRTRSVRDVERQLDAGLRGGVVLR